MISHLAEELHLSSGRLQQGNEPIPLHTQKASITFEGYKPEARFQQRVEHGNLART